MATITIRTDSNLKIKAQEVAGQMGLSISSLINWLLKKVVRERKVEFTALTENWFTPEYEDKIVEYVKSWESKKWATICETDKELQVFFDNINK